MKTKALSIGLLFISTILLPTDIVSRANAQPLTMEQIRINLINNPPSSQNQSLRKLTILSLDEILQNDSSRTSTSVINFYSQMIQKANTELRDTFKDGVVIWMMYNDGFVVKTPDIVFAFDLISGYSGWRTQLPPELINQIRILFISHNHTDHYDASVANKVRANGGYVVVPAENSDIGNIPIAADDTITILGLRIKAYYGLHSVPLRMYEVTCPNGLKLLHTGDNQTSQSLPQVDKLDVLFLDGWVNESGMTSAVVGMRNCIGKLKPSIMIPGHIQELGHDAPTRGATYEWAFEVADASVSTDVRVMAWGERFVVVKRATTIVKGEKQRNATDFVLCQNYPNPFNPTTAISYQLMANNFVKLRVFNVLGAEVATLVNEHKEAGTYSVKWNASNVPSGIYFYRLQACRIDGRQAAAFIETKKAILLK